MSQAALLVLRTARRRQIGWLAGVRWAWAARRFLLRTAWDETIFWHVAIADEYRLRGVRFTPDDVVVDIGAHVGCFALACHRLGARHVLCYEPHRETYEVLARNCSRLKGVVAHHAAVFRSDVPGIGPLRHSGYAPEGNTGHGSVLFGGHAADHAAESLLGPWNNRGSAPVVALDDVLARLPRVRLLKLDCEGSEFPILLTSSLLDRVERLVCEYHPIGPSLYTRLDEAARLPGYDRFDEAMLCERLANAGFQVETVPGAERLGLLWASR